MLPRLTLATLAVAAGLGVATLAGGCAGAPGAGSAPRQSGDVITRAEIEKVPEITDAYTLVERLRPGFLMRRGAARRLDDSATVILPDATNTGEPIVYVNDARMGGLDALRNINAFSVMEIRRYSAAEASQRYGMSHFGGALAVTVR